MAPTPHDRFGCAVELRDGVATVHLSGDLDAFTAAQATGTMADVIASGPRAVVVDLGEVEFIDSHGLRVLFDARLGARKHGTELSVGGASPTARRVLSLVAGGRDLLAVAAPSDT